MIVTGFAPAKINLYLHVAAPRADGLHPLDSLVAFAADVGDIVSAAAADSLTLKATGPFSAALAQEPDNLVLRAARLLAERSGIAPRAALRLDKHLPVASGVGGGSSDAAATLRVLNRLWRVNASVDDLAALARALGADVPACVHARTLNMQGVGDVLSLTDAPAFDAVLVNPRAPVATAAVYRAFDAACSAGKLDDPGLPPTSTRHAISWLRHLRNDLEAAARGVSAAVGDALDTLIDAAPGSLVRMSGSGATCFALVESAELAAQAADAIAAARPGWWVRTARLGKVDVDVVEG